jgi:non-heme chloroperoxidase
VLVDAVTPGLVKPGGLMIKLFDDMRAGVFEDMSQFWEDLAQPFYGANRPGAKVAKGILDRFWLTSMQCGLAAAYYCIKAFSESDFTEDLKKFDIPTLIIHGDDDQIVPINVGGDKAAKMVKDAEYHVYKGAPHGLMMTHQKQFNADLLAFANEKAKSATPGRRGSAEPASRAASSR